MAHSPHTGDENRGGQMDSAEYAEHYKMWLSFWSAGKWGAISLIIIAALLAIFRTHNG